MTHGTMKRIFAVFLSIGLLSGCTSTRMVDVNGGQGGYVEVNRSVEGKVARILLRDGTQMDQVGVRVDRDSVRWLNRDANTLQSVPTHDVAQISVVRTGSGALRGLLFGVVAGAAVGGVRAAMEGDDPATDPLGKTREEKLRLYPPAHAVYAVLATTPLGAILGTRRVYRFDDSGGRAQ